MAGRPFAVTLVAVWAVLSAGLGAYQSWLTTTATTGNRIALAVAALGGLIGIALVACAFGLLRTRGWARPVGLLAFALGGLVVLVNASIAASYLVAGVHVAGTLLAIVVLVRHGKPFSDTEGTPDEISAHVGR
jgi:hypothetical protein